MKATIDDIRPRGQRVLVRVDFNVPMKDGAIVDDRRIRAALPTLRTLRDRGARVIVVTHLGRPKGKPSPALSTAPLAARLGELLGTPVRHIPGVVGPEVEREVHRLQDGDVAMLENVRFEPGEEKNDEAFVERLAALADLYVNDAFGTAHRAHGSTEGIAHHLSAVSGYLMARELEALGAVLENPHRPLVAIIGGAKISTKIGVVENLLQRVDTLWIGGAMACTFFRAMGLETGRSLVEEEWVQTAADLLALAGAGRGEVRLPVDVVVTAEAVAGAPTQVVEAAAIPAELMVVDVGPETTRLIGESCAAAGTVVWNGPLGIYEIEDFARGTRQVAEALGRSGATSVVGGGDLAAALEQAGVADRISHISTGGGATLEFLEGRELPGVAALEEKVAL
ncbi:MAG: phosphoglycerate kinase [Candidatus Dormiibacterota bacterium]